MEKILIVTSLAGFIRGFLVNDIKTLQSFGYEVHCAADANNEGADGIEDFFDALQVKFHQIDFDSKNPFSKSTIIAFQEIRRLINEENYVMIHCHTPIAGFITRFAARKVRKKCNVKVLYTTHGFYFHNQSPKKDWMIFYPIEFIASAWSDAIITINNEDYNRAKNMKAKKCFHINGVGLDVNRYKDVKIDRDKYRESIGIGKEDIMVLAAGELSVRKNHQIIIKAIGKLKDNRIVFVLCGRAMQGVGTYDLLQKLADENNVRLKMLGFRSDMPEIFSCSDIGVLPSLREGLGMAGLQSLISGVPLVTSNVHGIVDYMEVGKTGYMYSPYDADGFAEGISTLCDSNVRNSMRDSCIEMALRFSEDITMKQMQNIYEEVLLK